MPWQECSPMELRKQFVIEFRSGLFTMTELCAQYVISRKTGYKWVARAEHDGLDGLGDRSRRPHGHPARTAPEVVAAILAARRQFPTWSGDTLVRWLARHHPGSAWPSRTTAYEILKRAGAVRTRRRRARSLVQPRAVLHPAQAPNELWTTDFKGEFLTRDGRYCHPLTVRDAFSRQVLRCDALLAATYADTRRRFERAFAEFGLPWRIRSDNGRPFASTGLAGLSRLNVWWLRLGIGLERIAPGHPEQNGSHEQFHAVLKAATTRPPAATARAQQQRFDAFRRIYNEQRPHQALRGYVPADLYRPSPRSLPRRLPPLEYPSHWEVRSVASNGDIAWRRRRLFVTAALAEHDIAFEEIDDALFTVWFGEIALARFDARHWRWTEVLLWPRGGLRAPSAG
jgi:putative transposase